MARYASDLSGLSQVDHPLWALVTRESFAWCSNIGAVDACKARISSAAISVNTCVSIASVSGLTGTAVLTWTLMVAFCICMTVVFVQLARIHLLAHSTCACCCTAEVPPAIITRALISVGANICAAAMCTAGIVDTVPNVMTLFSVTIESRWARPATISVARCRHIYTRHGGKAWSTRASIRINAINTCPRVAGVASTAVAARTFVVACGMDVAVVRFLGIARTNLFTRSSSKEIARLTCALIRVRSSVCAAAETSTHDTGLLCR